MIMRSFASVCLSVCTVRALTFESLDLKLLFLTLLEYLCRIVYQGHWIMAEVIRAEMYLCVMFTGGLSLTESLSCWSLQ